MLRGKDSDGALESDSEDEEDQLELQKKIEQENLSKAQATALRARHNWQRLIRKVMLANRFVDKTNKSLLIRHVSGIVSHLGAFLLCWPYFQLEIAISMLCCANVSVVLPYTGFPAAVRNVVEMFGIGYLYRGWACNYIAYIVPSLLEEQIHPIMANKLKDAKGKITVKKQVGIQAVLATINSFLISPMEVIAYKLLTRVPLDDFKDTLSCCKHIYRGSGILGFFKGWGLGIVETAITKLIGTLPAIMPIPVLMPLFSWVLTTILSCPISTLRARVILYHKGTNFFGFGAAYDVAKTIYRYEGLGGFFKGVGVSFWMAPGLFASNFVIGILGYFIRKYWLDKLKNDTEIAEYTQKIRKIQGKPVLENRQET